MKEIHIFTVGIRLLRDYKYEVSLYVNGDIKTSTVANKRTDIKQSVIDMINNLDFETVDTI